MRVQVTVAAVATAMLALFLYGQEQRRRGAAEANDAAQVALIDSLTAAGAKIDTVWMVKVDTFYVLRRQLDTLTATVELWKHDTVKVVEYVARADSTIQACSSLIVTCEERVANRDATITAWAERWERREKPPSELRKWLERAFFFAAGRGSKQ